MAEAGGGQRSLRSSKWATRKKSEERSSRTTSETSPGTAPSSPRLGGARWVAILRGRAREESARDDLDEALTGNEVLKAQLMDEHERAEMMGREMGQLRDALRDARAALASAVNMALAQSSGAPRAIPGAHQRPRSDHRRPLPALWRLWSSSLGDSGGSK